MSSSILLLSNSYQYGAGYLTHYAEPIKAFLKEIKLVLFVPYATDEDDWDAYTQVAGEFFNSLGIAILGIHQVPEDRIFTDFEAIFIGGGDAFRLHDKLQSHNLLSQIRSKVLLGKMRYLGVSAGANIAGQTIYTTKETSIPDKYNIAGLNLFPFKINPHHINSEQNINDKTNNSKHDGRNDAPLVELTAGSYLSLDSDFNETKELFFGGNAGSKIFFRGKDVIKVDNSAKYILTKENITLQKTTV